MKRSSLLRVALGPWLGVLVVACPALAEPSAPEEPLTRRTALVRALRQNPQIAAARARVLQARAQRAQADAARWPILAGGVGTGPALQADLVPGTAVASTESLYDAGFDDLSVVIGATLDVIQPIYTFGKIGHRREAADHGVRARRAQADMTRADVALEVARLYEAYLLARDGKRFFEEVLELVQEAVEEARRQIDAGSADASPSDLLELRSGASLARLELNRATAGLAQAEAGLRAYLVWPDDASLAVAEDRLSPVTSKPRAPERLTAVARSQRPELTALGEGAAAMHALADAEQADYFPDLFVTAGLSAAYTPGRDLVDTRYVIDPFYHFLPYVLVGLRWQFQVGMPGARADARRAEAEQLLRQRRWVHEGAAAQVHKAYEDARRAQADVEEAASGVDSAKEWVVRTMADYAIGLGETDEVSDALQAYAALRSRGLEAGYRYNVAMAELAHATGALARGDLALYPGPPQTEAEPSP